MIFQTTKTETTQTTEIETAQTMEVESIRITDHKTIQTIEHNKKLILIIDPVITLEKETTIIRTDRETILNRCNGKILNFQTLKVKTKESPHQNIKVQSTDETNSDPPGIDNTETSEIQKSHIHCETTDDESDTEKTLIINMLKLEN